MRVLPTFLILVLLSLPFAGTALGKAPKEYQEGILLDLGLAQGSKVGIGSFHRVGDSVYNVPVATQKVYHALVQVGDIVYTGQKKMGALRTYDPGLIVGDPVQVRIDKKSLFLLKPNGKESKLKIVKRSRIQPNSQAPNRHP